MDPVNRPAHYTFGKYEVKDVIRDWNLGFSLGNSIKYIARAGRKDPAKHIEDLKKAVFYLNDEIAALEREADAKLDQAAEKVIASVANPRPQLECNYGEETF